MSLFDVHEFSLGKGSEPVKYWLELGVVSAFLIIIIMIYCNVIIYINQSIEKEKMERLISFCSDRISEVTHFGFFFNLQITTMTITMTATPSSPPIIPPTKAMFAPASSTPSVVVFNVKNSTP